MNDWVNAEQHAERARTFFQNGEWDKALAELTRAIELNPEQGEWHFGLGLTLDALHRHEEAIVAYEHALDIRGEDPEIMMHVAVNLIHLAQYEEAIDWLERCNRIDPRFEPGYCYRIAAYAHLNDHEKAEEMFYLARQVQEECPHCCDHLAHSLAARDKHEKAVWCWQQTLRLTPDHENVRAFLGRAHWRLGQLERANVLFEQQLTHHPDDLATRLQLGRLQIEMQRPTEAIRTFRSLIDLSPDIAEAHDHLGELLLRGGHLSETITACEHAARLNPMLPGVHHRWALAELQRGRFDHARSLLLTEVDKPDHTAEEAIDISRTLMDLGMMSQAVALLTRVVEESDFAVNAAMHDEAERVHIIPKSTMATVLLHRSYAYLVSGLRRAGIADCRRSLKLSAGNALSVHNLALAYVEEGQLRRAAYYHHLATMLRPRDPMVKRLGHRLRRMRINAWFKKCWRRLCGR